MSIDKHAVADKDHHCRCQVCQKDCDECFHHVHERDLNSSLKKIKKKLASPKLAYILGDQMDEKLEKANTVRLPPSLQKWVERVARRNHLAISDVIRLSLEKAIPVIEKEGITIKPG